MMVLALTAFTLAQAPHQMVPMGKAQMRNIIDGCLERIMAFVWREFKEATLNRSEFKNHQSRDPQNEADSVNSVIIIYWFAIHLHGFAVLHTLTSVV